VIVPPLNVNTEKTELVAKVTVPELITAVSTPVGTCAGLQFAGLVQYDELDPVQVMVAAVPLAAPQISKKLSVTAIDLAKHPKAEIAVIELGVVFIGEIVLGGGLKP
jgi:hypothetical protein